MVLQPPNPVRLNGRLREPPRRDHSWVPANWPLQRLSLHVAGTLSPPRDALSESSTVWSFVFNSSSTQPRAALSPVSYSNSHRSSNSSSSSTRIRVSSSVSGSGSTTDSCTSATDRSTSTTCSPRHALVRPHRESASTPPNPKPSLSYTRLEQATTHTQLLAALQTLPDLHFGSGLVTETGSMEYKGRYSLGLPDLSDCIYSKQTYPPTPPWTPT